MPNPLPGAISSVVTPDPRPNFPTAFDVGKAKVKTIPGPVAATQGSILYPDAFAYGFVLLPGRDTRNALGGRISRYGRGIEDVNTRKVQ